MTWNARVLADSLSPDGVRLTTMEVTFPRIVLAEFNTHRTFSRNSASSRAIPIEKMIERALHDPYVPDEWPANGPGMSPAGTLGPLDAEASARYSLELRDLSVWYVRRLQQLGVHKEITNRYLEPWLWHTVIVTATEWDNFYHQRCHPAASRPIRLVAEAMRAAHDASIPRSVAHGEWHLPLIQPDEAYRPLVERIQVSVARCARVSYLTHDGRRDWSADLELYHGRLLPGGHMSPFEHAARPALGDDCTFGALPWDIAENLDADWLRPDLHFFGNFRGWWQHRKDIPGEADKTKPAHG